MTVSKFPSPDMEYSNRGRQSSIRNKRHVSLLAIEPDINSGAPKWEGRIYKYQDGVNFDRYLEELGVGPVLRKIANSTRPVVALRQKGDTFTLITATDFATTKLQFQLCKEFAEETLDGRQMKTTMSMFNNVLIQHQMGEHPSTIVREFHNEKMISKFMVNGVEAIRVYKVVDEEQCKALLKYNEDQEMMKKRARYRTGCCC